MIMIIITVIFIPIAVIVLIMINHENIGRCLACEVYGGSNSIHGNNNSMPSAVTNIHNSITGKSTFDLDAPSRRHCITCGLWGNIWSCLVCAHTGCGR
jgi:uncharacterized UBP type Zn finger protein